MINTIKLFNTFIPFPVTVLMNLININTFKTN